MTDSYRILIVDDDLDILANLSDILSELGYDIITAASGQEALERLGDSDSDEVQRLDLCLLDFKMPGMDGIAVLEQIKEKYPKTEVIFLTGHAATQDGVEGIKTGAFDYLSKPIEFEHLFGKIKQAYEKIQREEEKLKEAEYININKIRPYSINWHNFRSYSK